MNENPQSQGILIKKAKATKKIKFYNLCVKRERKIPTRNSDDLR